jgi:hypothetical protein
VKEVSGSKTFCELHIAQLNLQARLYAERVGVCTLCAARPVFSFAPFHSSPLPGFALPARVHFPRAPTVSLTRATGHLAAPKRTTFQLVPSLGRRITLRKKRRPIAALWRPVNAEPGAQHER